MACKTPKNMYQLCCAPTGSKVKYMFDYFNANGKHVGADSASLCSIAGCGGDRRTNSSETGLALLRGIGNFYAIDEKARKNEDSDREAKQTQDGEHGCDRLGDHREDRQGSLDRQRDRT